jgi:hypothetical protein
VCHRASPAQKQPFPPHLTDVAIGRIPALRMGAPERQDTTLSGRSRPRSWTPQLGGFRPFCDRGAMAKMRKDRPFADGLANWPNRTPSWSSRSTPVRNKCVHSDHSLKAWSIGQTNRQRSRRAWLSTVIPDRGRSAVNRAGSRLTSNANERTLHGCVFDVSQCVATWVVAWLVVSVPLGECWQLGWPRY